MTADGAGLAEGHRSIPWRVLVRSAIGVLLLIQAPAAVSALGIFDGVAHVVQQAGQAVANAGQSVANVGQSIVSGAGGAVKEVGKALQNNVGGDGAKLIGETLNKAGQTVQSVGDATANFATTGVAKPAGAFIVSLGSTAQSLGNIDLRNPDTILDTVRQASATASGVVLDSQRALEHAALDAEDLAVGALPAPLEKGVRHLSGEAVGEIEKKNPGLARILRFLPITSQIYNHLRILAKDEMACDPSFIFAHLSSAAEKEVNDTAKYASLLTTPIKAAGLSGWTATGCRGSVLGIADHDSVSSADNIVTIDLRLVAVSAGGQAGPAEGHFIRVEVLPLGRAHDYVLFRQIKKGEAVLVSGPILRDEDGPFFEIHPIDDLEVVAVPVQEKVAGPGVPPPMAGRFVLPARQGEPSRFTLYVIQKGDSLASIAERFYGHQAWPRIFTANASRIRNPDLIHPGSKINIPISTRRGLAATGPESPPAVAQKRT